MLIAPYLEETPLPLKYLAMSNVNGWFHHQKIVAGLTSNVVGFFGEQYPGNQAREATAVSGRIPSL